MLWWVADISYTKLKILKNKRNILSLFLVLNCMNGWNAIDRKRKFANSKSARRSQGISRRNSRANVYMLSGLDAMTHECRINL